MNACGVCVLRKFIIEKNKNWQDYQLLHVITKKKIPE